MPDSIARNYKWKFLRNLWPIYLFIRQQSDFGFFFQNLSRTTNFSLYTPPVYWLLFRHVSLFFPFSKNKKNYTIIKNHSSWEFHQKDKYTRFYAQNFPENKFLTRLNNIFSFIIAKPYVSLTRNNLKKPNTFIFDV